MAEKNGAKKSTQNDNEKTKPTPSAESKPAPKAEDAIDRVERLIRTTAYCGKEMYFECFGQGDRKIKMAALPLLERVDDFEVCGTLLILFIKGKEAALQEIAGKLQGYLDELQEDLTDVKAKISCNKEFLKQIRGDYETFCNTFDEMIQLFTKTDKRVAVENTTNRNEDMHKINMQLMEAEIKLMQSERARANAVNHLSEMNEARHATEVKLIDAFEEVIMEAESRHLIIAEQSKKKAEALCVRAERKHTDVEMGFLKIKNERRDVIEAYENDINKRYNLKVRSKKKSKSSSGSDKTPNQSRKSKDKQKSPKSDQGTPRQDKTRLAVPNKSSNGSTPSTSPRLTVRENGTASLSPGVHVKNKTPSPRIASKSK